MALHLYIYRPFEQDDSSAHRIHNEEFDFLSYGSGSHSWEQAAGYEHGEARKQKRPAGCSVDASWEEDDGEKSKEQDEKPLLDAQLSRPR